MPLRTVAYRGPGSDVDIAAGGSAEIQLAAEALPVRRVYSAAIAGYQLPDSRLAVEQVEVEGETARMVLVNRDANNSVTVASGSVVLVAVVEGD